MVLSLSKSLRTAQLWRLVFRRERWLVAFSLLAMVMLSWWYMVHMAMMMPLQEPALLANELRVAPWGFSTFFYMLLMWLIMMVGMMIPSAAPTILAYDSIGKNAKQYAHSLAFTLGYLGVWSFFSVMATLLQWLLSEASLLSPSLFFISPKIGAFTLMIAGLYQCSSLKGQCLIRCRSPFDFLTTHLKPGVKGAFNMGLYHGAYCLGCCWVLMLLLFVGGVMNLMWIALLTLFVLLEKILPYSKVFTYISGGIFFVIGVANFLY